MNDKALKALNLSIAHWKRMATGKARQYEIPDAWNCALCEMFLGNDCSGCPIRERTGIELCEGSPYSEAYTTYDKHGIDSPAFKTKAFVMLAFLNGLLPSKKKASPLAKSPV